MKTLNLKNLKNITLFILGALLFMSCAQNITLKGHVYTEYLDKYTTDNDYDAVDGDDTITIKCGEQKTTTDTNGNFTLEGSGLEGNELLIQASKDGYQTAYVTVTVEDIDKEDYKATPEPKEQIVPIAGGAIEFWDATKGTKSTLDLGEGTITILMLKTATTTNWNVLKYK